MSWIYADNSFPNAIVGLSSGNGEPPGFSNSDLTGFITDWDADGIIDSWEIDYFGSTDNCVASENFDGDHLDNISEYICGSNPTNEHSFFTVSVEVSPTGPLIQWDVIDGRRYRILKTDNLAATPLTPHETVFSPQGSYTDTSANDFAFYQVVVEMDD